MRQEDKPDTPHLYQPGTITATIITIITETTRDKQTEPVLRVPITRIRSQMP